MQVMSGGENEIMETSPGFSNDAFILDNRQCMFPGDVMKIL